MIVWIPKIDQYPKYSTWHRQYQHSSLTAYAAYKVSKRNCATHCTCKDCKFKWDFDCDRYESNRCALPMQLMEPIHETCSFVKGPESSGVFSEDRIGRAGDTHPIIAEMKTI